MNFEINTYSVRNESYVFSEAADDLKRYSQELRDIRSELSGFSDMEDIEVTLITLESTVYNECQSLDTVSDALMNIVRNYDDTEDIIIDRVKCINYLDFSNNVSIGYFDIRSPRAKPVRIDMEAMEDITLLIS